MMKTVLPYKKGDLNEPENFHPITLQHVLSNIFTSVIRNRMYQFVETNEYIESNLQKGFWEKVSGCAEHIETLTHIITNAQLKQKGCIITLLDLKNVFDDVNHQLLKKTLKLHHLPDDVITLISSLYSDYDISLLMDSFLTSLIRVHRGVLTKVSVPQTIILSRNEEDRTQLTNNKNVNTVCLINNRHNRKTSLQEQDEKSTIKKNEGN